MGIGQVAHALGEVTCGPLVRHLHMPPRFVHVEKHEQIGRAVALIFVIVTLGLTRCCWDWLAHFTNQLCWTFVEANHLAPGVALFRIKILQYISPSLCRTSV